MTDIEVELDDDEVEIDLTEADEAIDQEPIDHDEIDARLQEELDENYGVTPDPPRKRPSKEAVNFLRRHRMSGIKNILDLKPGEWFIKNLIPVGGVTILHGPSGGKKSFLMLDWMLCAATGSDWHHHDLRPGRVLYIVAEGVYGTGKRIRAWAAQHDIDPYSIRHIDFMADAFNLFKLDDVQLRHWGDLIEYLRYDYIVVDTLHMTIGGADENSSQDMGTVFRNARRIAGERASLFFVHHDPKDGTKTARGSGSIRDDADVVITFAPTEKDGPTSSLESEKIKDAGPFNPIAVTFAEWEGVNEHSLYVESVAINQEARKALQKRTAVDECAAAIIEHELPFHKGAGETATSEKLKALDLGYAWRPSTVGKALKLLRDQSGQVDHALQPKDET